MKQKLTIILFCMTMFALSAFSLLDRDEILVGISLQNDWILSSQKNGINVSYKLVQCGDGNRILLQIQNSTPNDQIIDLGFSVLTDSQDINIPSLKNTVQAGSILEGTCNDSAAQATFILLSGTVTFRGIVTTIN